MELQWRYKKEMLLTTDNDLNESVIACGSVSLLFPMVVTAVLSQEFA